MAIVIVLTIFYVFLDEESDSGIRFYPPRLDFGILDEAILHHVEKWPHPVQQNLVKMDARFGFIVQKNIEKGRNDGLSFPENNFSGFLCNEKMATSGAAKSRRDRSKQMRFSDSSPQKT